MHAGWVLCHWALPNHLVRLVKGFCSGSKSWAEKHEPPHRAPSSSLPLSIRFVLWQLHTCMLWLLSRPRLLFATESCQPHPSQQVLSRCCLALLACWLVCFGFIFETGSLYRALSVWNTLRRTRLALSYRYHLPLSPKCSNWKYSSPPTSCYPTFYCFKENSFIKKKVLAGCVGACL